jgi:hypothetical protein
MSEGAEFPGGREFGREFFAFGADSGDYGVHSCSISNPLQANSLLWRGRKLLSSGHGIFAARAGNSSVGARLRASSWFVFLQAAQSLKEGAGAARPIALAAQREALNPPDC